MQASVIFAGFLLAKTEGLLLPEGGQHPDAALAAVASWGRCCPVLGACIGNKLAAPFNYHMPRFRVKLNYISCSQTPDSSPTPAPFYLFNRKSNVAEKR